MNPFLLYNKRVWQSGHGVYVRKNDSPGKIFVIVYASDKEGFICAAVLILKAELKMSMSEIARHHMSNRRSL
jgi:hypothetical protein